MKNKKMAIIMSSILTLTGAFGITQSQASGLQQVTETAWTSYAKTKYPLVFVHGLFGFNRLGSAEFGLDYFYQVLPDLARNGATTFATRVAPMNSNEVRGEQLLAQVEEVIAITGKPKVNLIGHSQGGPTTRYVLGTRPDLVASVTNVAGANDGSPVADAVLASSIDKLLAPVIDNLFGPVLQYAMQHNYESDITASLNSLSTKGAREFNQRFPAGIPTSACADGASQTNGIYMYSFTGIGLTTNILDPDTLLTSAGYFLFDGQKNDGLISQCSSRFGKTIRDDYNWNHFDEVNQVMGLRDIFSPDPVDVYRQHANRLKLQGL